MESPTGIIPEELMDRKHKAEVLRLLRKLPIPGPEKEKIAQGWAVLVGTRLTKGEYNALYFSDGMV